jgi:hypothetical protein
LPVFASFASGGSGTTLRTVNFSAINSGNINVFTDIDLVVITNSRGNTNFYQFDNINVSSPNDVVSIPAPQPSTAVPEPFSVLGTLFGAGYGVALKRKLAKAKLDKEDIS